MVICQGHTILVGLLLAVSESEGGGGVGVDTFTAHFLRQALKGAHSVVICCNTSSRLSDLSASQNVVCLVSTRRSSEDGHVFSIAPASSPSPPDNSSFLSSAK